MSIQLSDQALQEVETKIEEYKKYLLHAVRAVNEPETTIALITDLIGAERVQKTTEATMQELDIPANASDLTQIVADRLHNALIEGMNQRGWRNLAVLARSERRHAHGY